MNIGNPINETVYAYKSGIYLTVHNQSRPKYVADGLNIPTGHETFIGVHRSFISKQEKPYSDCLMNLKPFSDYSKILFGYFTEMNASYYDQGFCFELCYQDKLIDKCNCCDISTSIIRNSTYCVTDEQLECENEFDEMFAMSNKNLFCESACPQQCNEFNYDTTYNMATFPTSSYLRYLSQDEFTSRFFPQGQSESNLTEFARQSFLKIIVNYDNLYYTSIEENPQTTFETLLGNIGGQLGLFLGLSFLSFVEIVEYMAEVIMILYKHGRNKNQVQAKQNNQEN